MRNQLKLITVAICAIILVGPFGLRGASGQNGTGFGEALPEATAEELLLFLEGRNEFIAVKRVEDGLGPLFNGRSCAQCHAVPAVGGSSMVMEVRAGRVDAEGVYSDLPGGSLFHLSTTDPDQCQEVVPADANVIAFRQSTPVFGSGLIEAIPDELILANADPTDEDGDGISGRANRVLDVATQQPRVGRFGWKAQQATLPAFSGDALLNELGITSDLFPDENAPNGDETRLADCDQLPDPEDIRGPSGRRAIDHFTNFMRFLAPPPRDALTPDVLRGEATFSRIGCALCHRPQFHTGVTATAALNQKVVPLFSDLLLHDVGTGDGIVQSGAGADELRTPPLWGLRMTRPFLHDGSAATIEQAILAHAGEAAAITEGFTQLTPSEKRELLAFLNSL